MNPWFSAATVLIVCLFPCLLVCSRGDALHRLVGLEAAGLIACMALLLLAEGFHRPSFTDLALALALLSFAGGLVFVRFLGRWL